MTFIDVHVVFLRHRLCVDVRHALSKVNISIFLSDINVAALWHAAFKKIHQVFDALFVSNRHVVLFGHLANSIGLHDRRLDLHASALTGCRVVIYLDVWPW